MDIASTRNNLIELVNELVNSYNNKINIENNDSLKDKQTIKELNNQVLLLQKENNNYESENKDYKKNCYEYECMINKYQDDKLKEEKDINNNNKVSLVITQANELEKKDRYIEQLEKKINNLEKNNKKYSNKNINIETPIAGNNTELILDPFTTEEYPKTSKTKSPKSETPKTESPIESSKTESPIETPKSETPKSETPKSETPKTESPIESSKTESPIETPKSETPKSETPKSESIDEEPILKKIKIKGNHYYIITNSNENPQNIYAIKNNTLGYIVGERKLKDNGKYVSKLFNN